MEGVSGDAVIERIQPSIGCHSFSANVAERLVRFEVLKFKDSLYVWIGDARCRSFSDMSLAIMSRFSRDPASTKIMGDPTNLTSANLASKLTKKLNKPVYVSYNLPDDRLTVPAVSQRLTEEMKNNEQYF